MLHGKIIFEGLPTGVSDLHVHTAPDSHPLYADQRHLALQAQQAGHRAILFKSHNWITHNTAVVVRDMVPGVEIFGGIVLNRIYCPDGRPNVYAVKKALQVAGGLCRCVWLPTFDAAYNAPQGSFSIAVVDTYGRVLPEVTQIMELCAEANIICASGHSSPTECVALAKQAKLVGCQKFVITHASETPWRLPLEQVQRCLEHGAFIEHSYIAFLLGDNALLERFAHSTHTTMQEFVAYIRLDVSRSFIDTDLGQIGHPAPVEGMNAFMRGLLAAGLTQEELCSVAREVPHQLLGIEG